MIEILQPDKMPDEKNKLNNIIQKISIKKSIITTKN